MLHWQADFLQLGTVGPDAWKYYLGTCETSLCSSIWTGAHMLICFMWLRTPHKTKVYTSVLPACGFCVLGSPLSLGQGWALLYQLSCASA